MGVCLVIFGSCDSIRTCWNNSVQNILKHILEYLFWGVARVFVPRDFSGTKWYHPIPGKYQRGRVVWVWVWVWVWILSPPSQSVWGGSFVVVESLPPPPPSPPWRPPLLFLIIWYRAGMVGGGDIPIHNGKLDPTRSSKLTFSTDITPQCTNWLVIMYTMSL